jgi:hypothetical protein
MTKFVSSSNSLAAQTLYHGMPWAPRGDAITPSDMWGATLSPAELAMLGMAADEHAPLLFAATTLNKALPYAIIKGNGKLFNQSIDSANAEIVVACDRGTFMAQPVNATIFSFPGDGFMKLPNFQHQGVSAHSVPFSKTKIALKANSMDDLMRAGLQIFTFNGPYASLEGDAAVDKLRKADNDAGTTSQLATLLKSGKVIWENQTRGLNPNAKLAEMMGIKLAAVRRTRQPAPGL